MFASLTSRFAQESSSAETMSLPELELQLQLQVEPCTEKSASKLTPDVDFEKEMSCDFPRLQLLSEAFVQVVTYFPVIADRSMADETVRDQP